MISDGVIALAYFTIPFALALFAYKRPDVQYSWIFWSFAIFILACGLTHVMSIWTLWHPDYGLEGVIKAVTAVASIVTAAALWPLAPKVLAYPTPSQFRRMDQALVDTERQLRILVDGVTDYAIFMLDPAGRITNWNTGAQRILGYSREEVLDRDFSILYTEEARREGIPEQALSAAAKRGKYEDELLQVRKDGGAFWASIVVNALYGPDGALVGFAKITQDITERRESEERLRASREQLFRSQKMEAVGQLTGGVAHDFNNLLMIVLGNLEIAQRHIAGWSDPAMAKLERALSNAANGAKRASTLTQRLLAFSRRQPLSPRKIDVSKLLHSVEELLRGSLPETIDVEVVSGAGVWIVDVDGPQLESAIVNLALNSRDAMKDGGKLTIESSNAMLDEDYSRQHADVPAGQYVRIAVSDTGDGMAPDIVDKAFEPFFTTKPPGQGTGLGLSQVYGFVKQSGGHIQIYSEPEQGTTVNIYLPRAGAGDTEADVPEVELAGAAGERETILVVEDDAGVRDYLVETLRDLDYRVIEAPSAEVALRVAESEGAPLDLLLTDVVLPGMNGRQLAERLQARRADLKVLYMSGYSRNAIVHQGRLDAGVSLLQKPVTRAALSNGVRRKLDGA